MLPTGILGKLGSIPILRFKKSEKELVEEWERKQKTKIIPKSMLLGEPELKGLSQENKLKADQTA